MIDAGIDSAALDAFVKRALTEDLGEGGDITSRATIPEDARLDAVMACREAATIAGLQIAVRCFRIVDPSIEIETLVADGTAVCAGAALMNVGGNARRLLTVERTALNIVQHLTGVATMTRLYADAIAGTGCILLDTRKTTPGLRVLEKYAARMGGARNHRMRLDDGLLIKDNHIAVAGGVDAAVSAAKRADTGLPVQVEIDRLDQVEPALAAGADRLLCDNMLPSMLAEAVALVAGRVPIEASGGVRLETIRAIAASGVTYVSVGRITQSAPAADIGLDYRT